MGVRSAIDLLVRFALPPRCAGCGTVTAVDHRFCAPCWSSIRFLGPPCCAGCGVPFAFDRGEGAWCEDCVASPPRHAGIRAAVAYGPVARTVALRLKYGGRIALAETAARLMVPHLDGDGDLLVPVPLHRGRIWTRGFNQAALIAAAIGRARGVPVERHALIRQRATPVLRGLGRGDRKRALAGAFAIHPRYADRLRGRSVVLIDDVHTSGATSEACVAVMLAAGAARVSILCWARVLDPGQAD